MSRNGGPWVVNIHVDRDEMSPPYWDERIDLKEFAVRMPRAVC